MDLARALEEEVHIWTVRPRELAPGDVSRLAAWLTSEEHEQAGRFVFEEGRRDHVITRGLVRWALSRYARIEPAAWRFASNEHGRPHVTAPGNTGLHFNVSHTTDLIVCAVANRYDVGVDVEKLAAGAYATELADRVFSPAEAASLRRLTADELAYRFVRYWTLKEAYIKARGLGLAIALDQFSMECEPERPVSIAFGSAIDDTPEHWQFTTSRATPSHLLAAAFRHGGLEPRRFVIRPGL